MAKKLEISTKHLAINKANAQMVTAVAVASFLVVFCLVATHSLWSQRGYLSRVTKAKEQAKTQLADDVQAINSLKSHYDDFVGTPVNVLGQASNGQGDNQGDNAHIILDALPNAYDFPALTSSIEKIVKSHNLALSDISGTDDEVAQAQNTSSASPQPVSMPFSFTVDNATYQQVQDLLNDLQRSIRPIQIDKMTLSGAATKMELKVEAHTFYQPAVNFKVTTEVVK